MERARQARAKLFAMLNQPDPMEERSEPSKRQAARFEKKIVAPGRPRTGERRKKWEPADAEAAGSVTLTVHSGKT